MIKIAAVPTQWNQIEITYLGTKITLAGPVNSNRNDLDDPINGNQVFQPNEP